MPRRCLPLLAALVFAALVLPPEARSAGEVTVFAAASLAPVMEDLAATFKGISDIVPSIHTAGSNTLRWQIEQGFPADVLVSASAVETEALRARGLVADHSVRPLLRNRLVVIAPMDRPAPLNGLTELPGKVKRFLAMADPDNVPAGRYAREAMRSAGVWDELKDRIAPALDVRAATALVAAYGADYGIVYQTEAVTEPRVAVVWRIPDDQQPLIHYTLARVTAARHPQAADAFYEFLLSPAATKIFQRYGFEPVQE